MQDKTRALDDLQRSFFSSNSCGKRVARLIDEQRYSHTGWKNVDGREETVFRENLRPLQVEQQATDCGTWRGKVIDSKTSFRPHKSVLSN